MIRLKAQVQQCKGLNGEMVVPGDKSISHRAVLLGAIANGRTTIENFLSGADCANTIKCLQTLGVKITVAQDEINVWGLGKRGLKEPSKPLDAGNSGTTARLLMGILAGQSFYSILIGDEFLSYRPMGRLAEPLKKMGAIIDGREGGKYLPLSIRGGQLKAIDYTTPVASAQLKSAILLAGLYSDGETTVTEQKKSRNHTELMLQHFGATLKTIDKTTTINGLSQLTGQKVVVPSDISSAAFFLVAGLIIPNSELMIKGVGLNPTRSGIITVLQKMGGQIKLVNKREIGGELIGDIWVKSSILQGITIQGDIIPSLIDEIPIIAVAAAVAQGETIIKDAVELKVKETNRIATICAELNKFGAQVQERADGLVINGVEQLTGTSAVDSHHDHRIAMAMAVAGLKAQGTTTINNAQCVEISYPNFFQTINTLSQ